MNDGAVLLEALKFHGHQCWASAAGVPPTEIPTEEAWELVDLIWDAPQEQVLTIGPVENMDWSEPEELVRFAICEGCGELVAESYMRLVEGQPRCGIGYGIGILCTLVVDSDRFLAMIVGRG